MDGHVQKNYMVNNLSFPFFILGRSRIFVVLVVLNLFLLYGF